MNTETRMLRYHFSPEEHLANCAEMARLLGASDEMELTNKQIKTSLKEAEEVLGADLARHGRFVRDGYDHRKTECRWDMDVPVVGQKSLIRIDSGDLVEVRRMEDHEKQGTLFDGGKRVDMSPEEGICKACQADIPLKEDDRSHHVDEQPCKAYQFVAPVEPVAASPEPSLAGATASERKKARRAEEEKKKALKNGQGWPEPNEHGMYEASSELILEFMGKKCAAAIEYLQIGPDQWIAAVSASVTDESYGSPLTAEFIYPSKEIAIAKTAFDHAAHAEESTAKAKGAVAKQWLSIYEWFSEQYGLYAGRLEGTAGAGWMERAYRVADPEGTDAAFDDVDDAEEASE